MSTCLISMCRNEADIAEAFVRHAATQVDHLILSDNGSTDGTREILAELAREFPVTLLDDPDPAYYQSLKMTGLARRAFDAGFGWVLPADFDEVWYSTDGRPISRYLDGLAPDIQIVRAALYDHLPTALDPDEPNPVLRIGWRKREHGALPKVACRARPDLVIHAGNHGASTDGTAVTIPGALVIRHFTWRSADGYVAKIRQGQAAYAATDLPEGLGLHWRMWAEHPDDTIRDHFRRWFWSADPYADETLIFDPAPAQGQVTRA